MKQQTEYQTQIQPTAQAQIPGQFVLPGVYPEISEQDWEWLCSIPGIYHSHQEILLRIFGSPEAIRGASEKEYEILSERGLGWIRKILEFRVRNSPEKVMHVRKQKGIQL